MGKSGGRKWIKLFVVLLICSAVFLLSTFQNKTLAVANCDVSASLLQQTSEESALLGLINSYRAQNGLGSLSWSAGLKKSAAWHSNDMSNRNTLSHIDSLGRDAGTRIRDCGYAWTTYHENIQKGSTDAQGAFTAWKNSPPHNAAMLNQSVKEAGISSVNTYWTLDLGNSSSVAPSVPIVSVTQTISQPAPSATPTLPEPSVTLTQTPTPTPKVIINPTDTTVEVSIKINGVGQGANQSPKHLTRPVAVGIFDASNKQVLSGNGFLKYDGKNLFRGVIHLGQLASDAYFIKIASSYTLVSLVIPEFQNLDSKTTNVLPVVSLIQGDLDTDNIIDINDYNIALPCFQNKNCPIKDVIDFNDDGKADVIDYNLLLSAFRKYEGD